MVSFEEIKGEKKSIKKMRGKERRRVERKY